MFRLLGTGARGSTASGQQGRTVLNP
ncbi:unnamed protein product [Ectocarpus sp. CCAP 1310/34]|nr:unnamed protein product [Ectocarpus sp. CCAP 1310/34]